MRKLTFLAIGALMLFGVAAHAGIARAADPLPVTKVMGAENAQVLQQSLNVLGATLNQLDQQLDANQLPADPSDTKENLVAIHGELIALRSTIASLEDGARALAENNTESPAPVVTQAPQSQILSVVPLTETETKSATELLPEATDQNNKVASATLVGKLKNYIWPSLIVLVVIVGIFFLRLRKRKVLAPEKDHDDADMFSSLPTITDY